jgi:hypothetical protein
VAKKIKTALPPNVDLGGGWTIEWDAVDPTTGASVAGVKVSKTSLLVGGEGGLPPDFPNPILVAVTS